MFAWYILLALRADVHQENQKQSYNPLVTVIGH